VRRILLLLAIMVGTAALVPTAAADKPTREHVSFDDLTLPGICSFTVTRHVLVNRTILTTFSDGNQRYTGTFKQRLTNLDSGKHIDVTSSGPVLLEYHADGSLTETDYGPQFERPPGQLLLTSGRVVWEFDPAGNLVSYTQQSGTARDVCTVLA
jgi:hypothetical protein